MKINQFEKLIELSNKADGAANESRLPRILGKVSEEIGEFNRAIYEPDRCDEDFVQEGADAIIALVDAIVVKNAENGNSKYFTAQCLYECIDKSLEKWENKN